MAADARAHGEEASQFDETVAGRTLWLGLLRDQDSCRDAHDIATPQHHHDQARPWARRAGRTRGQDPGARLAEEHARTTPRTRARCNISWSKQRARLRGVAIVVATARPGRGHAQRKDNTREGATKVAAHQRRRERPWTDLGVLEIEQRRRERKGYARPPGNGRRPACREGSRGEERVGTNRRGDDASREKERGRAMGA